MCLSDSYRYAERVLECVCATICTRIDCTCTLARLCQVLVKGGGRIGLRHRCGELCSFTLIAVAVRAIMALMRIHYDGSQE